MAKTLQKKRVAILVTDGFEQDELDGPRQALDEAGALTEIVSAVNLGQLRASWSVPIVRRRPPLKFS
jgi:protease I